MIWMTIVSVLSKMVIASNILNEQKLGHIYNTYLRTFEITFFNKRYMGNIIACLIYNFILMAAQYSRKIITFI